MRRSFELGTIRGVRLRVQPALVWLLLALVFWRLARQGVLPALETLFDLALLTVLVLVHELGHALVARRFGVRVIDITLWPLGGMARLAALPENSRTESWIAAAGPIVNLVLALCSLPLVFLVSRLPIALGPLELVLALGLKFGLYNAFLGLTNLVPAFPMDGGRILRAQLARRSGWLRATEQAVRVSRYMAALTFVAGVLWSPILLVLGAFIWWASWMELAQVRARHAPERSGFARLFDFVLRPGPGQAPFRARSPDPEEKTSQGAPSSDFERVPMSKSGFSEEDILRLERWHGRLPRNEARND
jgi:Zn-dependent protease